MVRRAFLFQSRRWRTYRESALASISMQGTSEPEPALNHATTLKPRSQLWRWFGRIVGDHMAAMLSPVNCYQGHHLLGCVGVRSSQVLCIFLTEAVPLASRASSLHTPVYSGSNVSHPPNALPHPGRALAWEAPGRLEPLPSAAIK